MTNINKRHIGSQKELLASNYLESKGYKIIQKNFWTKYGEIDIIAYDDSILVFTEVKYRNSTKYGFPEEAVSIKKQNSIRSAAYYYMSKYNLSPDNPYRFDVIVLLDNNITHYINAF